MLRLSLELLKRLACSPQGRQLQSLEVRGVLVGSLSTVLSSGQNQRSRADFWLHLQQFQREAAGYHSWGRSAAPFARWSLPAAAPTQGAWLYGSGCPCPCCLSNWPEKSNKFGNGMMSHASQRSSQMGPAAVVPIYLIQSICSILFCPEC